MYAQDVQLSNDTVEHNLNGVTQSYKLTTPVGRVTFLAKHTARATTLDALGTLTLEQKVNNKWVKVYEGNPGIVTKGTGTVPVIGTKYEYEAAVGFEQLSFDINYRATELRFTGNVLNNKQIKNVCTYMASFVELTPATLDFGEMVVWSEPVTRQFTIEHCNVQKLAISSSNSYFVASATQVANSGIAQYAKETFSITFTPDIMGQHQGAVYVQNGTQKDSVVVRAKVTKRTPVFTFLSTSLTVGDTIDAPLASDCDNRFLMESCDASVVAVSCGRLVALAPGEATITAMQLGDDNYWNNRVETFNVTVVANPIPTAAAQLPQEHSIAFDGQTLQALGRGEMTLQVYDAAGRLVDEAAGVDCISMRATWPVGTYTAIVSSSATTRHAEKILVK